MKIPKFIGIKLKANENKDNIDVEYEPCEVVEKEKLKKAEKHIINLKQENQELKTQIERIKRNVRNNYVSKLYIERQIDEIRQIEEDYTYVKIRSSDIRRMLITYLNDLVIGG